MTTAMIYTLAGACLFGIGLAGVFFCAHPLRKVMAVNLAGGGVFLVMIALALRPEGAAPDPVPHALVLTGIVVAVSATAAALALFRRLMTWPVDPDNKEVPRG